MVDYFCVGERGKRSITDGMAHNQLPILEYLENSPVYLVVTIQKIKKLTAKIAAIIETYSYFLCSQGQNLYNDPASLFHCGYFLHQEVYYSYIPVRNTHCN